MDRCHITGSLKILHEIAFRLCESVIHKINFMLRLGPMLVKSIYAYKNIQRDKKYEFKALLVPRILCKQYSTALRKFK
jgi:hypothetical protein